MPDEPNAWICRVVDCEIAGRWQQADLPTTAEQAWLEHWRREHKPALVKP